MKYINNRAGLRLCFAKFVILGAGFSQLLVPLSVLAAASDLDPTFGASGRVVTDLRSLSNQVNDIAVQPDGKTVVIGRSFVLLRPHAPNFWTVVRYKRDGSLDDSFGIGGSILSLFPGGKEGNPFCVAIQSDGKIVVAGLSEFAFGQIVIVRYRSDGSIDDTFDNDGIALVNFDGLLADVRDMAIQGDGKIVITGTGSAAGSALFVLARLQPDGSLDETFGSGGTTITDFGTSAFANGLTIQPDGKIVVTGTVFLPFTFPPSPDFSDFALARYRSDGSLDTSFNGDGKVITDVWDQGNFGDAVALQSDGKLVVAGATRNTAMLLRYLPGGSLDPTFGADGVVIVSGRYANDVAIQQDDKPLITTAAAARGFTTTRLNANGSPDLSFGASGIVITGFASPPLGADFVCCLAIRPDRTIVVGGTSDNADRYEHDFALASLLAE